jgi:hypothetical protein
MKKKLSEEEMICKHLKEYMRLLAPKGCKKSAYAKKEKEKFVFGYVEKGKDIYSRVSEQVAIAISMGLNRYMDENKRIRTK